MACAIASTSGRLALAKPTSALRLQAQRPRPIGLGCRRATVCMAERDVKANAAMAEPLVIEHETVEPPQWAGMSYNEQYDLLMKDRLPDGHLRVKQYVPKPDAEAQAKEPGAKKIFMSDVYMLPRTNQWVNRDWTDKDKVYGAFMIAMHGLAACAPFCASWGNFGQFMLMYFITGACGITLSFHRQLTHRSFETPKWLEYVLAYCGVLSVQGDPIEWVSCHRYHHVHCDTPLDPHSPYEGFWWSHAGWLMDDKATQERVYDRTNAKDMAKDPFYQHLEKYYVWHVIAQFVALYAIGGFDTLVWAGALRICWVYHITWFVNSASHVWGYQDYNTGDQSRNNWWVGILAFGEGWHNNHHAFESSARHGLEWWQLDMTWLMICALREMGLATNIKLPTEKQKERLRLKPKAA